MSKRSALQTEEVQARESRSKNSGIFTSSASSPQASQEDAGQELRSILLKMYCSNEPITAVKMAEIAHWQTLSGGLGLEDMTVDMSNKSWARNASRHLKHIVAKDIPDPSLTYVEHPAYDKLSAQRVTTSTPMELPSSHLKREFGDYVQPASTEEDCSEAKFDCPAWDNHVVRQHHQNTRHWSLIVPCALYWDGVQYTKRDTLNALYFQNLRSREMHLVVVISPMACSILLFLACVGFSLFRHTREGSNPFEHDQMLL